MQHFFAINSELFKIYDIKIAYSEPQWFQELNPAKRNLIYKSLDRILKSHDAKEFTPDMFVQFDKEIDWEEKPDDFSQDNLEELFKFIYKVINFPLTKTGEKMSPPV